MLRKLFHWVNHRYMIILNLLPKEEKIACKQERTYLIIKNSLLSLIIAVIIITLFLLSSRLILEKNFYCLINESCLSSNLPVKIKRKIDYINNKFQDVSKIQKGFLDFSKPLIHLSGLLPENVQISMLNLDKDNLHFLFKGMAKNRENLLEFQKKLEDSSIFEEIKYPLSNLLYKEEINFEFSGKLNFSGEQTIK